MKIPCTNNRGCLIGICIVLLLFLINWFLPAEPPDKYHPYPALSGFLQAFILVFLVLRWALRRRRILIFNLLLFLGLAVAAEFTFFLLLGMPSMYRKPIVPPKLRPEHIASYLGSVYPPCEPLAGIKVVNGDTVFNVKYTIDQYHRRETPGYDAAKSKYAVFFGCSVCFGFGLDDDQTMPYYFQERTAYNAYNYSAPGYGTHQMLARLEYEDLSQHVRETEGIGIYVFLGSHIRRSIGDMKVYTHWGSTMPYYHYDGDGNLVRDGTFFTGRPFLNWLYVTMEKSSFFKYFDLALPLYLQRKHLEFTADLLAASKARYQEQFGNDRFLVLFHPTRYLGFTKENMEVLKEMLDERGIKYLDYIEKIHLDAAHRLRGDPHPNALAYQEVAELLAADLESFKW